MVKLNRQWFFAFIVVFLTACSVGPTLNSDSPDVIKSDNDTRDYRYLVLPNQLRVLLVSDPNTERSAAALDVNVGSGQDPLQYQGLAHFLEHMLFLGTEKYPEAGEYQAFISSHGGSHNAYTSFDHTNYFFDISPESFAPALDRFAQFFIAPLFTEQYVDREKNAVHSEYMAKIKNEQRKSAEVFKSVINPEHPFAKFSVGNLQTLAGGNEAGAAELREQLLEFYHANYSASVMTLVVVAKESLNELEVMVKDKFAEVKNNGKQVEVIEQPLFAADTLPMSVQIKPEKSLRMLTVAFPIDDATEYYREKPVNYLGNIIGHEGEGSLLSYLKQQGWAEGLGAGLGLRYMGGATFNVSIQLTEKGAEHSDDIVAALFQTINRIKQAPSREWLFEEQKIIAEQQFRFQQKQSPMDYASSLAMDVHYYDKQDILRGAYMMTRYDSTLVDNYLNQLTPDNSVVTLISPEASVDQVSQFYQAAYRVNPTPAKLIDRWNTAGLNAAIRLPKPNDFIARDLSLVVAEAAEGEGGDIVAVPELLIDKAGLKLWFKGLDQFVSPRGSLRVSVKSPLASDTVNHRAELQMLTAMLTDQLNELSYSATLAGLSYSLRANSRGFSINIDGFSDRQDLLLDRILTAVDSPEFNAERFENIRREYIRKLENTRKKQPYYLLMEELPDLLYQQRWSGNEMLAQYQTMTLDQLKEYKNLLLQSGRVNVLLNGNYRREDALDYAERIRASLLQQPTELAATHILKLPEEALSRQVVSDYADASILLYMQAKDTSKVRRAAMGVTAQLLRADFYTSLRTEKQLGYIVNSGAYPVFDVPALYFLVQSPVAGAKSLQWEVDQFLQQRVESLDEVTEEYFLQQRNAVLSRLYQTPQNLWEQSERYWQDIKRGHDRFDSRQQLIAAMEGLSFAQWRDYFIEDVANNQRRLYIYTVGQFTQQEDVAGDDIDDMQRFKSQMPTYVFP